jgi:hypothetical protein
LDSLADGALLSQGWYRWIESAFIYRLPADNVKIVQASGIIISKTEPTPGWLSTRT